MQGIVANANEIKQKIHDSALLPVRQLLPDYQIEEWCRRCGLRWRKRFFTPVVSLLMCAWKHMDTCSARAMEDRLASMVPDWDHAHRDGRDFLNARARLSIRVFQHAVHHVSQCAQAAGAQFWQGLRVAFVDGTTTSMPRTEKNVAAFGTSSNQHGPSHCPLLRILLISCAGTFFDVAFGPYTAAEARLWIILLLRLPSNMLVIGDTTFCSYMALCLARQRGSHLIAPVHSGRRKDTRIETLGKNDELHRWSRPRSVHVLYPRVLATVPETIDVRIIHASIQRKGYRDYSITLCTTLLDPRLHPIEDIVRLYLQRWNIEVDIRTLKTVHGLEHLTAKSPQIIIREMYSAILAFNCSRALMAQSGAPVYSLSHQRCTTLLLDMACQMSQASTTMLPSLFRHLLRRMAEVKLDQNDRPPEPRVIVRNRRRFPYLTKISRSEWRKQNHAIPA